ncbi:MAG TPA: hypothetical protein VFC51_02320 [Chloroflexota bacterium]|nr:hypothetical protein [Chloroflexota bacterium]
MRTSPSPDQSRLLMWVIVALALADGVLHFALDFILFRGNLFGPVPGPPPRLFLPLNQLFVLNAIGYVILVGAVLITARHPRPWAWVVDAGLALFAAAAIVGWVVYGLPNPRGLGYASKAIEAALLIALAAHMAMQRRAPSPASTR